MKKAQCNCLHEVKERVENKLKDNAINFEPDSLRWLNIPALMFDGSDSLPFMTIGYQKPKVKKEYEQNIFGSYCPFCGMKYQEFDKEGNLVVTEREEGKYTWRNLQEDLSQVPKELRDNQAVLQIDDESQFKKLGGLSIIEEDVYVNKEDNDDSATLEELKYRDGEDFIESDYRLSTPKGTLFLHNEF